MKIESQDIDQKIFDDESNSQEVMREKMIDILTPGYQAEFDPLEAEKVGAFVEDAMSETDALESTEDAINQEPTSEEYQHGT